MKLLRKWFNFYIDASVHVAIAVTSLVLITSWELSLHTIPAVYGFVFFGTITGYNFVKYAAVAGLHHRSLTDSLKGIQLFSIICFGVAGYFLFRLPMVVWYVTALFGLLTFFYAVPFLPAFRRSVATPHSGKNLRTLAGSKIFIVGLVWAGMTVLLPWSAADVAFSSAIWLSFAQRFLLVVVWTLPFEIRDLPYDLGSLRTLPQQLGIKRAKGVGLLLLISAMVLESVKAAANPAHFLSFVLLFFGTAYVLMISKKKQSRHFASFWVESIPIFWMLVFFILKGYLGTS